MSRILFLVVGAIAGLAIAVAANEPAPRAKREPPGLQIGASAVETITDQIFQELGLTRSGSAAGSPQAAPAKTPENSEVTPPGAEDDPADNDVKAPPKSPRTTARSGKDRLKALEADAQECETAEEALLLYKAFMADPAMGAAEIEQARPRREFWETAVKEGLVRLGKKWVPKQEADRLQEEADRLVREAIELLAVRNYSAADAKLERASRILPDHLESLFLLGVGAFLRNDVKGAEKRFSQCVARAPNHVPVLNNIAVCEVHARKFDRAVRHWAKAAAIDSENAAVAHNLGKFIFDAGRKTFGNVDRRVVSDASDLYTQILSTGKVARADTKRGYLLIEVFRARSGSGGAGSQSQVVGNGSGFVVWPGFVLTNRHVVQDADGLVLQDPADPDGNVLHAQVVATSNDLDLALLRCEKLGAPGIALNSEPVGRGTEVLALGFPITNVVGKGLKATRGIVTGLPSKDTGNLLVLDAQTNPGNSGGPLCDRSGRVIGIVTAKTFTERFVQGYGLAIPISEAVPFITKNVPGFTTPRSGDRPLEWTEVDSRVSKSTVMVLIQKKNKGQK